MYEQPDIESLNALKKELVDMLQKNNYDFLSSEVLVLSRKIDMLIVPLFKEQLDHYFSLSVMQ